MNVNKSICAELPFRRSLKTDEVLAPLQLLLKHNVVMVFKLIPNAFSLTKNIISKLKEFLKVLACHIY